MKGAKKSTLNGVAAVPREWFVIRGAYAGVGIFAVSALAAWLLDRPSAFLTYATDAILPIYLMHQTALVVTADTVVELDWPLPLEFAALLASALLLPLAIYHLLIRNTPILRVLFGLRPRPRTARPATAATPAAEPA